MLRQFKDWSRSWHAPFSEVLGLSQQDECHDAEALKGTRRDTHFNHNPACTDRGVLCWCMRGGGTSSFDRPCPRSKGGLTSHSALSTKMWLTGTVILVETRRWGNRTREASHKLSRSDDAFAGGRTIWGLMTQEATNRTYAPVEYAERHPISRRDRATVARKDRKECVSSIGVGHKLTLSLAETMITTNLKACATYLTQNDA